MRLALKGTLIFLALYALVVGAAALWVESQLNTIATTMVNGTARLIGNEIARAITGSAMEQLVQARAEARQRLDQIVNDVTEGSNVVAAVVVVNAEGEVVASDADEVGHRLALPQVVFPNAHQTLTSRLISEAGDYHLFVPLTEDELLVGYVRLSLKSQRIGKLYRRARRQFLVVAATGFVGVVIFGVFLHFQLLRRTRALAGALQSAVQGDASSGFANDEFAQALDVAREVGRELTTAREQRSQAQRRFGALTRAMRIGILLMGPDQRLEFASPAARELLGCAEADAIEPYWNQIEPQIVAAIGRSDRVGASVDIGVRSGDEMRRLRFEVSPLDEGGESGHLVVVKSPEMVDLVEKELGFAFQMRGLARFYTAFAHDLKTPLQGMAMNLELLKQTLSRNTAGDGVAMQERQLRYADVLRRELSQLDRQLRALLNHVAPPSDTPQRVDLRELVLDIETLLGPQAQRQRVTLATRVSPRPAILVAKRDRLKQAMLNLTVNALEAMPNGGTLDLTLAVENNRAAICVRDSGAGIAPDVLPRIYDMNFTTKPQGTGAGLYIVRSVIESHGGSVHVQSQPGRGATFRVELPLPTSDAPPA